MALDPTAAIARVDATWDDELVAVLSDYIRVPALSPAFDEGWVEHGHLDAVVDAAARWAVGRAIADR